MKGLNMIKGNPVLRFADSYIHAGAHTKPADTRTTKQLLDNIEYYAQYFPEVKVFKKELKAMNPQHLGLVSDICELTRVDNYNGIHIDISKNIDIRKLMSNGKSLFASLIELLPKASKENPESLHFAQEVINQTDTIASKYFLASCPGYFTHPQAQKHLALTRPFIKGIAEATLTGKSRFNYADEEKFVGVIQQFVNPSVKLENLEMLSKISSVADDAPLKTCYINPTQILHSEVPIARMEENLDTFKQISNQLSKQTDEINLTDFVVNNVNLD